MPGSERETQTSKDMKRLILVLAGVFQFTDVLSQVRIDHAIMIVNDLDSAIARYDHLGFTIKPGKLHENGLLNAHIKFQNGSAFELMTLSGIPGDKMARTYKQLLAEQEGGVYLALTGHQADDLKAWLHDHQITYLEMEGKVWSYISFPEDSPFAHLFFIDYHFDMTTINDPTNHVNGMEGFQYIALEGDRELINLLAGLGLFHRSDPGVFETSTGDIQVIMPDTALKRPRLRAVSFKDKTGKVIRVDW